jgi:flagellar protein FlaG
MSLEIGRLTFQPPVAPASRPAPATPATGFAVAAADAADVIPPTPPREVLAEVKRAAARAEEMAAGDRELHFSRDTDSGRIVVEVRDLEGNVLRTIPPSKALDVMSGGGL